MRKNTDITQNESYKKFIQGLATIHTSDRLVGFLYLLMRDHLPAGVVAGIVVEAITGESSGLSNGYLAQFAIHIADKLKEGSLDKEPNEQEG